MKIARISLLLLLFALIPVLAGCNGKAGAVSVSSVPPAASPTLPATATLESAPAPTQSPIPTATATVALTVTPSPTVTPTATPSPSPTASPTATPMNPLSVEFMRRQAYPGSDPVIEETLAPGANYNRYIASYKSEGLLIYALLTVPKGEKPASGWPVIIFNHGYIPPAEYRTTERYVAYTDAFSRNGYIVFKSDYRGHGKSQGAASSASISVDYTVDVLNAVASMKRYKDADPNRIGMWGHSMGGSITLRAMVTTNDIRAGDIWAGVVGTYPQLFERWDRRPQTIFPTNNPTQAWRAEMLARYGAPDRNPAFWDSITPNAYVKDLSGPLQIQHGTADTSVPLEFSETLYRQVQAAGGQVTFYTYPGDDHNIAANLSTALARSVAFFDKYVKNAPPAR